MTLLMEKTFSGGLIFSQEYLPTVDHSEEIFTLFWVHLT